MLLQDNFILFSSYLKRTIYQLTFDLKNVTAIHTHPSIRPLGIAYDRESSAIFYCNLNVQRLESTLLNSPEPKRQIIKGNVGFCTFEISKQNGPLNKMAA